MSRISDYRVVPVPPGATLGRYTLLKRLATSGDAELLLARATGAAGFEHHVVIKRMRRAPGQDPQAVDMFLDELRLTGSLHHHHIVQVHDAGREGNDYFFAMEYVHGEDLRKILTRVVKRGETIPLEHVVTVGLAIAQALHHAHEQKTPDGRPLELVHRAVTPANVIIGYDGTVKVLDFGLAKASVRNVQTRAGTLRGKAAYMAPEQCAGREIDRRADIFALGIVLWELVTAKRLFKGVNDFMTMGAIVGGKVPPPARVREDLPADFEKIILKALSPKPEGRYQTAEQLAVALDEMAMNNIIRVSQSALVGYMKQLFGTRPEPWLVEEGQTEVEGLDPDFDGPAGIVKVTKEQVQNLDAVREVLAAQQEEQEQAPDDDSEDEFDDEPMTELADADVIAQLTTDPKHMAAAVEAAKILRPTASLPAVERPSGTFDVKTSPGDEAETNRLRQMSSQMGAVQPPTPAERTPPPQPPPQPPPPRAWSSPGTGSNPMSWMTPEEPVPDLKKVRWSAVVIAGVIALAVLAVLLDLLLR